MRFLFLVVLLVPNLASAASLFPEVVRAKELNEVVRNLDVSVSGLKVRLFGMLFSDCSRYFVFTNVIETPGPFDPELLGVRVLDAGGRGRACMRGHLRAGDNCSGNSSDALSCARLSATHGTTLDLSGILHERNRAPGLSDLSRAFDGADQVWRTDLPEGAVPLRARTAPAAR